MRALSINFLALPSSKNIEQDYGARLSTITLTGQPDETVITGVFVNGMPQWTAPGVHPCTVSVRPPLLQQGERVEVRCVVPQEAPEGPHKALHWPAPAYPTPSDSYGLQRRSDATTAPKMPKRKPYP